MLGVYLRTLVVSFGLFWILMAFVLFGCFLWEAALARTYKQVPKLAFVSLLWPIILAVILAQDIKVWQSICFRWIFGVWPGHPEAQKIVFEMLEAWRAALYLYALNLDGAYDGMTAAHSLCKLEKACSLARGFGLRIR